MQFMRFRLSLVLALIGLVAGFAAAQEIALKLRYQPGQTLNYKVTVEGKVNLVSEVGVATDLQFKGDLTQEQVVKEVADDGTATLLLTVSGKMRLISPTEGSQPTEQEVPTTKVMMKIAPDGRIVEVKPVKEEGKKSGEQLMALQDPFQALTMSASAWSLLAPNLPLKPVKVGETWEMSGTVPITTPSGQSVQAKVIGKGKLVSVERKDGSEIAVSETQIEIPELGEVVTKMLPLKEMGVDMQVKGGTKSNSKHWFDLTKGLLTRSEVNSETKMVIVIQMPENVGAGTMTLQTQTQVKSVIELVSVKP
ncbi:hypothetical protein Q2T83_02675 [Fervidibacter sacchari]|uniref:DUF5666 domain-containing protein n=1 Tax=Candidatus Fervidibacter sacchari TaxID=1448929 RepID=A0ABT2EQ29_9BACT|nr:hypothetical protein [Candidatus Fervidibacter sacchari]MCS3920031.1 hypothetical protein [Candidatus Fervidibacter sacchari]WKU16738.1 hypothetical protein Q2T83_02675 [Candidatus Fervidibacter sacchari]